MKNIFLNKYKAIISIALTIILLFILYCTLSSIGNYEQPQITLSKNVKDSIEKRVRLRHAADSLEKAEFFKNDSVTNQTK